MAKEKLFKDRYKKVEKEGLGAGGQGSVYTVKDTQDNDKIYALKTINFEKAKKNNVDIPQAVKRLKREWEALNSINSDYVISVQDSNLDNFEYEEGNPLQPFFVMKLAKNKTLKDNNYFRGDIDLCLTLFKTICFGVKDIHQAGIVHRDLKPTNILLFDSQRDLKICDLGICYFEGAEDRINDTEITKKREMVGTQYYSAPEQTGSPPTNLKQNDFYSLGRILYWMIIGEANFKQTDEYIPVSHELSLETSHAVDRFIQKLINVDPKQRHNDIDEVLNDLSILLSENQETESPFEKSKMQERILKYIESFQGNNAEFHQISSYVENFYSVEHSPLSQNVFMGFAKTKVTFARDVEKALEQLENAELVFFINGEYSA
jgi:serine/threonine protein kinase